MSPRRPPSSCARGRLLFDISHWDLATLAREPSQPTLVARITDATGTEQLIEETAAYDAATQVRSVRWHFSPPTEPDRRTAEYRLRVAFPQESKSPRQVCIGVPR